MTREEWERNQNKYGTAGLIWNGATDPRTLTNGSSGNGWNFDPRYMRQVTQGGGDGESATSYEFTDHYNKLFDNGRNVQVRDYDRLKDPTAVQFNDETGYTTAASNYKDDSDWLDKAFEIGAFAGFGLPIASHMLGAGGLLGGSNPSSGWMGGAGYEGAGMIAPGMEGVAAAESALINAGGIPAWAASGAAPGAAGSAAGGIQGLLGGLMQNPLQALGLLQMAGGLLGGGGSSGSNGGASGAPAAMQLPKGNRGAWTPNPHTARQIQNFRYTGG